KLLLAPEPKPAGAPAPKPDATRPRAKPKRLEAIGHVAARSPELTVHDTEQLVLLFTEAPAPKPGAAVPPAAVATPAPAVSQPGQAPPPGSNSNQPSA